MFYRVSNNWSIFVCVSKLLILNCYFDREGVVRVWIFFMFGE